MRNLSRDGGKTDEVKKVAAGEERSPQAGWKKTLLVVPLLLFLLAVAYYFSYVWWGRGITEAHPYTNPEPFGDYEHSRWAWLDERVYPLWQPLRDWERTRTIKQLWTRWAGECSGTWVAEDGRVIEIQLEFRKDRPRGSNEPWVEGWARSAAKPSLDYQGLVWGEESEYADCPTLWLGQYTDQDLKLQFYHGGLTVLELAESQDPNDLPYYKTVGDFKRAEATPEEAAAKP